MPLAMKELQTYFKAKEILVQVLVVLTLKYS
jgi:hypothetical protein